MTAKSYVLTYWNREAKKNLYCFERDKVMKFGCCVNMFSDESDVIGRQYLPLVASSGYDYVELPLAQIMELSDAEFEEMLEELKSLNLRCEVCNNFFPAAVRLTGSQTDEKMIRDYLEKAILRAERLGVERIVFGSSGAKNVPDGFDHDAAFDQIVNALQIAESMTAPKNILIVIEPLNQTESNIIINLSDGKKLMNAVSRKGVLQLVDYYHYALEKEKIDTLKQCAPNIHHVHVAHPEGRVFPKEIDAEMQTFLDVLRNADYDERISIEAYSEDKEKDLKDFLKIIKAAL